MRLSQTLILIPTLLLLGLGHSSCQKLDEDGGYYDEETETYKYVRVANRGVQTSSLNVSSPVAGKTQQIYGVVTRLGDDTKSIWIKIEDRKPYMIIAHSLSGGNREDKTKELRIQLKYVSPMGSVTRKGSFREKWQTYVTGVMKNQLLNKTVLIDIEYEERARKLWGVCYLVIETKDGDRARNFNLWMIQQGLSYYFIDQGEALDHKKFSDAQEIARRQKIGIWEYQ